MRLVERAFDIAMKERGTIEGPGAIDNPKVIEYLTSCDFNEEITLHDSIAWCSAFVNWCIQKAGGKGTRSAAARSWLSWGREININDVKPGDIVVFRRGKQKWTGHVAFVVEVGPLNIIRCLGGNQNDQVCIAEYRKSSILGFRTSKD